MGFQTETPGKVKIVKSFIFKRNSYIIDLKYRIENQGRNKYEAHLFGRLIRRPKASSKTAFLGVQTFTGMALNTPEKPYHKLTFKDVMAQSYTKQVVGGWAAMIEQYFTAAWVPEENIAHTYKAKKEGSDLAGIQFLGPEITVEPGEHKFTSAQLYAGPQVTEKLEALSPGLQLTVDYGLLWPVCQPIFWLLKKIYSFVNNWGVSIILVTLSIKLLFFKLSAASFKSMAKMRLIQPKMQQLKERFGDDKQKFGQAVMELYKKEKINPVGGCLPMLIQIPVFISLYYVLLGSVELHNAPFCAWIQDLSAKDPYYVLPVLMGMSMFLQQKFSPTPPDPVQAKVMMFMPIVFTFMFFQFPAGLVLYWLANNLLSVLQQWLINRQLSTSSIRHAR